MPLRCCLLLLITTWCAAVDTGDQAPSLQGVVWVGGTPAADKPKLVEVFATRLPTVGDTVPALTKLAEEHRGQLVVVGISDEDRATLEAFSRRLGPELGYPVGSAPAERFAAWKAGVRGLPHAFLVGADGEVLWHGHTLDAAAAVKKHVR